MAKSKNQNLFRRAAKERVEDSAYLIEAERTTASVYFAGYGVECILKSLVLSVVPAKTEKEVMNSFRGLGRTPTTGS